MASTAGLHLSRLLWQDLRAQAGDGRAQAGREALRLRLALHAGHAAPRAGPGAGLPLRSCGVQQLLAW